MVAEQRIEEMSLACHEDLVAHIIYEVLPQFAEACGEGAAARWWCHLLIAEVDQLCAVYGPL